MDDKEFRERSKALEKKQAAAAAERAAQEPQPVAGKLPESSTSKSTSNPKTPPETTAEALAKWAEMHRAEIEKWRTSEGLPTNLKEWPHEQFVAAGGALGGNPEIEDERQRRMNVIRLWDRSKVDLLHRKNVDVRLSATGGWRKAYDRLLPLVENGGTAILAGDRGRGKTQMAVCVMKEACEQGRRSRFCDAGDFFLDLRATYAKEATETERDVFEEYAGPHLLVVDEAHERSGTKFENMTLTRLINRRYANLKTTILITNEKPEILQESLGSSILSRVQETGFLITCDWENFRAKEGGE